ncbi:hypothetical protein [uncultured Phycicoccus sp.]|uniref:hypothetical protein n=1 Tax=uncultured Phycicoccus sp. TaxID=661422 RepID=UPI002612B590|nr:hypothetical protein [uncultured Phycicoccus sp.]
MGVDDPRRGLQLLEPVVSGRLACSHAPGAALAHDADLRSRLHDLDGAVASFRGAWPLVRDDPSRSEAVACCLRVLVRLGNTDRAVDLLLPRLAWLGTAQDETQRMWFAGTAAWVLRHGQRLGLAPDLVDGRAVADLQRDLAATARAVEGADARLAAALDDDLVAPEPTLPPTRLPGIDPHPGPTAPDPRSGDDVVALARRVAAARRELEPGLERALRGWMAARDTVRPLLRSPAEWAAAASLDRSSSYLLRDPARERARLEDAEAAAERAGDAEGAAHARADLAVLEVRTTLRDHGPGSPRTADARAAVHRSAADLEAAGHTEAAAAVWRWYALSTRPGDAVAVLERAAALYAAAGRPTRRALCLLDAAPFAASAGPGAVQALVDEAERTAADNPVIRAQALDLRARTARAVGDVETAVALHEQAVAASGTADAPRMTTLFAFCDLLVELGDWDRLERYAADALASAVRLRDPVALAVAQRHLGVAWVEAGRPAEAAELLEAALPVIQQHIPTLVGPTAWALGNASTALGAWADARRAFTTASAAFTAEQRLREVGHAEYRAGMSAWDDADHEAAAAHLEHALDAAHASGAVDVVLAASRSRAALRATTGDLDAGVADLDAVLESVERFTAGLDTAEAEEFDAEVLEPDILRQGAHLLAAAGRVDEAVDRLGRAVDLVGGDFALVLGAERGIVLADADRLEEGEPQLRASLAALRRAGLRREQVEAAQALAGALDRAGMPEAAQSVWDEFGPEG